MAKKQKLPAWATTVTPFSKLLALAMLVIFPIVGFSLGKYYQRELDKVATKQKQDCTTICAPQPTKLVVTRLANKAFTLAPFTVTITDNNVLVELYKGLNAFKLLSTSTQMGCPMIPVGYEPVDYDLVFYKDGSVLRHVIFSPPGCRGTLKLDNNDIETGVTMESVDFEKTLQHALNLSNTQFRGY